MNGQQPTHQPPPGWGPAPSAGGYPQQPPPQPIPTEAVIALVLAITSFMTTCFPAGFVALYLGQKTRKEAQASGNKNAETFSLVAAILGGISGGIFALFYLAYLAMMIIPLIMMAVLAVIEGG